MNDDLQPGYPLRALVIVAGAGGLLLGPIDLLLQRALPYPWANLANSMAVWAIAAFAIGAWARTGSRRPPLTGMLLLLVAVESYHVAAVLVQGDGPGNLWAPATMLWLAFGVCAGVVFGTAGAWSRGADHGRRIVGRALPGAVLFAEAAHHVHLGCTVDAAGLRDHLQTALIELILAAFVTLAIGRTWRERLEILAVCVPLTLLGFSGYLLSELAS